MKSYVQLLGQKKPLTKVEKRRLIALKSAVTRSEKKFSLADLEKYEFSSLSESEQYRLRKYWGQKAAKTRKRKARKKVPPKAPPKKKVLPKKAPPKKRVPPKAPPKKKVPPKRVPPKAPPKKKLTAKQADEIRAKKPLFGQLSKRDKAALWSYWGKKGVRAKKRAQKKREELEREDEEIFTTDFNEVLAVLELLTSIIKAETGQTWNIKRTGSSEQMYAKLQNESGEVLHPKALAAFMAQIDSSILSDIPNAIMMAHYSVKTEPYIDEDGKLQNFEFDWTALSHSLTGDIMFDQAIGALDALDFKYLADNIMSISITWRNP